MSDITIDNGGLLTVMEYNALCVCVCVCVCVCSEGMMGMSPAFNPPYCPHRVELGAAADRGVCSSGWCPGLLHSHLVCLHLCLYLLLQEKEEVRLVSQLWSHTVPHVYVKLLVVFFLGTLMMILLIFLSTFFPTVCTPLL